MCKATSTPSHIFTKQHLIKYRDFSLPAVKQEKGKIFVVLQFTLHLGSYYSWLKTITANTYTIRTI